VGVESDGFRKNSAMKKIILFSTAILMLVNPTSAAGPYKPGDNADDFTLKNVSGSEISLAGIENAKGFIVVFMCNTCPVVKAYEDRIIDLNKKFSAKGYPVVAINSNDKTISPGDSYDEMKKTAKSQGYDFQYLYDESQDVTRRFGATNTPHVYVLSKKEGKLKVEYVGAIDNNSDESANADKKYVEDAVNALLKGSQVAVVQTKAVGCSIKWKKT
jgi:peroxiredoxin